MPRRANRPRRCKPSPGRSRSFPAEHVAEFQSPCQGLPRVRLAYQNRAGQGDGHRVEDSRNRSVAAGASAPVAQIAASAARVRLSNPTVRIQSPLPLGEGLRFKCRRRFRRRRNCPSRQFGDVSRLLQTRLIAAMPRCVLPSPPALSQSNVMHKVAQLAEIRRIIRTYVNSSPDASSDGLPTVLTWGDYTCCGNDILLSVLPYA